MEREIRVDMIQHVDGSGRCSGFVFDNNDDEGGWFFTWESTLYATLRTLEPCSVEGDGGLDRWEVSDFLEETLPGSQEAAEFFDASVED